MAVVYISGAISSDPCYKAKFAKAERELRELGYTVLNPTILPQSLTDEQYLHIDFAMIDVCDVLYMLPDWEMSYGATEEYQYADKNSKKVIWGD